MVALLRKAERLLFAAAALTAAVVSSPVSARPEVVTTDLGYAPGSIVIVNQERKVYYVTAPGQAIRYGVAVGKESERWTGRTFVSDKKVDPKWIPVDGSDPVAGGDPSNPLGKRALYLDWSLLRIHGTPSRGSIGSAVSNGCIRMLNEDVMDLYDRVHVGAPVFAINSMAQAGSFRDAKVADLVYVNPAARESAKADEADAADARRRAVPGLDDDDEDDPRPRRTYTYRGGYGYPPPRYYRSQGGWPYGW